MVITEQTTPNPCTFVLTAGSSLTVVDHGVEKVVATPRVKCGTPAATIDFVNGYRCVDHPPRWEQGYAVDCHDAGRHGTADAYRRTMIALLKDRIVSRAIDIAERDVA